MRMNFLAVDIYRTIVLLHETLQRMVVKDFVEKKKR